MWQLNPPLQPQSERETWRARKELVVLGSKASYCTRAQSPWRNLIKMRYLWSVLLWPILIQKYCSASPKEMSEPLQSEYQFLRVKRKRRGWEKNLRNGLMDACTNTWYRCHDEGKRKTSIMDRIVFFLFCYSDSLSKSLQQREMLVANQWLKVSTKLGCGWTSVSPDSSLAVRERETDSE